MSINAANVNESVPYRILVAEDDPEIREHLRLALHSQNFIVDFAKDGEELLRAVGRGIGGPSLVILDVALRRKDGIATLKDLRCRNRSVPVIMLSGITSAQNRLEAIENGANDFLTKPISYEKLRQSVGGLLPSPAWIPPANRQVGISSKPKLNFRAGNWIRGMEPLLNRLVACDFPVLLQGETGVGKEILARHIHNQSLRSGKIFLKLNCAALPPELVESELFGYEKGAFTGAFKSTPGKFELAHGGTILLDEIGDMDLRLQAKLLQVLQDREFHRIGAKAPTQVDVRVIAATHRDLEDQIAEREFREDLYYRLNVVNIVIPPLRERLDEIVPLALSFLHKHTDDDASVPEIGPDLRTALLGYQWPGNIRELENVMRKYLIMRNPETIIEELQRLNNRASLSSGRPRSKVTNPIPLQRVSEPYFSGGHFPAKPPSHASNNFVTPIPQYPLDRQESDNSELVKLDQVRHAAETEVIMKALYSTQWNRKRAALLLGVDYKALLYKMKKLGID